MKHLKWLLLAPVALLLTAQAWGYWHASTHATIDLALADQGRPPGAASYRDPRGTVLELLDADGKLLARTRSVEPWGYSLAQHPGYGDCTPFEGRGGRAYSECFTKYARWTATWAMRTRFANVKVGDCSIARVPVQPRNYGGDWAMWWFPLQHGAGRPYDWVRMDVRFDSRTCTAAT